MAVVRFVAGQTPSPIESFPIIEGEDVTIAARITADDGTNPTSGTVSVNLYDQDLRDNEDANLLSDFVFVYASLTTDGLWNGKDATGYNVTGIVRNTDVDYDVENPTTLAPALDGWRGGHKYLLEIVDSSNSKIARVFLACAPSEQ